PNRGPQLRRWVRRPGWTAARAVRPPQASDVAAVLRQQLVQRERASEGRRGGSDDGRPTPRGSAVPGDLQRRVQGGRTDRGVQDSRDQLPTVLVRRVRRIVRG